MQLMTNTEITVTLPSGTVLSYGRKTDARIKRVSTFAGKFPLVLCRSAKAAAELAAEAAAWGVPTGNGERSVRFEA